MSFIIKTTSTSSTANGGKVHIIEGQVTNSDTYERFMTLKAETKPLRYMFEDYIVVFINITLGEFSAV